MGHRMGCGLRGRHQVQGGLPDGQPLVPVVVPVQVQHGDEIHGQFVPAELASAVALDERAAAGNRRGEEVAVEAVPDLEDAPDDLVVVLSGPLDGCPGAEELDVLPEGVGPLGGVDPVDAGGGRGDAGEHRAQEHAEVGPHHAVVAPVGAALLQGLVNERDQLGVLVVVERRLGEKGSLEPAALEVLVAVDGQQRAPEERLALLVRSLAEAARPQDLVDLGERREVLQPHDVRRGRHVADRGLATLHG